jgi:hypothetical protein
VKKLAIIFYTGLMYSTAWGQSASEAVHMQSIETMPIDKKTADQCGMSMNVPNLIDGTGLPLAFACTETYKSSEGASLDLDFEFDPNLDSRPGDSINFEVYEIGIDQLIASGRKGSLFRLRSGDSQPTLADGVVFPWSGCGPVVKTTITPLQGINWHGWIAEDTFQTPRKGCLPVDKEYTSTYRCIHVMVGNAKITAMLGGVCLLRKREYSLENGFSYDLFMDMLKTLRFKEG